MAIERAISGQTKGSEIYFKAATEKYVNKHFGKLFVHGISKNKRYNDRLYIVTCECTPNEEFEVSSTRLHDEGSCGCLMYAERSRRTILKDYTGKQFGPFKVVKLHSLKPTKYECVCPKGHIFYFTTSTLKKKAKTKCCSECWCMENGRACSVLQKCVQNLTGGVLNYRFGTRYFDICLESEKIVIEVDSWYWHAQRLDQDLIRDKFILSSGWKFIKICTGMTIPTQEEINECIAAVKQYGFVTLYLDGWGEGPTANLKKLKNKT